MNDTAAEIVVFDAKLKEERDFWVSRLSSVNAAAGLLPDFKRPARDSGERAAVEMSIEGELCSKLDALTGGSPFLLYTTLAAAMKVCLYKHTGHELIAVGSPALKELGRANALAVTDRVEGGMTFQQLLLKARESLLEAYARQKYPFDRLVRDLDAAREDRCPLFDVALSLEDIHGELCGLRNDITIVLAKGAGEIKGRVKFREELHRRESVEQFRDHFVNALREGVEDSKRRVADFELMNGAEREWLLRGLNRTEKNYPRGKCLHELFEAQVGKSRADVAVRLDGDEVTYEELNARANRLARRLQSLGVGPDALVAIYLERSVEMVVALLAVLKAGGAYLPLDLVYPKGRLAFILEDSGSAVLLTRRRLADDLPEHGARVVALDDEPGLEDEGETNPVSSVTPDNLAYVLYTSGSTGRPKGVMIPHAGLVNYLSWATEAYRVSEGSGAPVHSPIGFDLTVTSLLSPLLAGRSVLLLRDGQGIEDLLSVMRDGNEFSLVKLTPSHLEMLRQLPFADETARQAKAFVVGGEALYAESISFWRAHGPGVRIINEYGPTETVVGCCVYEVPPGGCAAGAVPIGRPISNTRLYVLDASMRVVPPGVRGELYIGGDGLARGYLNRPDLTAERFLPDPFSPGPGARLYRTGDVVRRLADGVLEYVGRADSQVKVRGYRVELGEVEAALLRQAGVREAAAVVEGGRISAFVVRDVVLTAGGGGAELREALSRELPPYMAPWRVVEVSALPLTENGKVDRAALPSLAGAAAAGSGGGGPETECEREVAAVWGEVLGAAGVGRGDDFFELGGHSLLATQVISRLRDALHVELPLLSLFESPTLAEFAKRVEAASSADRTPDEPITRVAREGELPLSFAQERFWMLDSLSPGNPAYNSYVVMRAEGALNVAALGQAVAAVVERHEALRTIFPTVEGRPAQVILPRQTPALPFADLSGLPRAEAEAELRRLCVEEAGHAFNLSEGPLIRVSVKRLGEREHFIQVTLHHIVTDGWSNDVLYRELSELYERYANGLPPALAELPVQYADYAAWQRRRAGGQALARQRDYWRRRLEGAPCPPSLSGDGARRPAGGRGATHRFSLRPELSDALRELGRAHGATLYMTLLAGYFALLHLYTGEDDLVVGSPVSGRRRVESEGLIGCFLNTLAVRVNAGGGATFGELLRRVREAVLGAEANSEIPFEAVEAEARRGGRVWPLFNAWFVLQQSAGAVGEWRVPGGLRVRREDVESVWAQFDAALAVTEEEGGALSCGLAYGEWVTDAEGAREMACHYAEVLEAAARTGGSVGILEVELSESSAGERAASAAIPAGLLVSSRAGVEG